MNHQPSGPDRWEPDWMKELRTLDAHIAVNVERYLKARRRTYWLCFAAGAGGVFFAQAVILVLVMVWGAR